MDPSLRWGDDWRAIVMNTVGIIITVIIGILLIGVVLKLIKFAIIAALVVGGVMLIQNKFGQKRIK
jgi:hypothetical protein